MALPREEWLARRNSRSMGQTLRALQRYLFINPGVYFNRGELVTLMKMKVMKGRNQRKRDVRSTKSSKKYWGVIK
jgi:predicted metalloprotease